MSFINSFIDPNTAATSLQSLINGANLYATFLTIGLALIALFTVLEIYRIWIGGGGPHDLLVLGIKVLILSYLITPSINGQAPLEAVVMGAYGYFARLGQYIASTIGGQQTQALWDTLNKLSANINFKGTGNVLQQIAAFGDILLSALMMLVIWGLFLLVFMIVIAIYIFAVLGSRMFLLVSILLAPLLLPLVLWRPMGGFIGKWISTTLHAFFLPVIGAVTLVVAINLGMVAPLQKWVDCVQQTSGPAYQCVGQQTSSFVTAIIGGLVAIFIMLSSDRIVSSFLGAAEVTATGLILARWGVSAVAGAPGRAIQAAERAREAAAPQTVRRETTNLDSGEIRREKITTSKIPQTEA